MKSFKSLFYRSHSNSRYGWCYGKLGTSYISWICCTVWSEHRKRDWQETGYHDCESWTCAPGTGNVFTASRYLRKQMCWRHTQYFCVWLYFELSVQLQPVAKNSETLQMTVTCLSSLKFWVVVTSYLRWWEGTKLLARSCYTDITPASLYQFRK